jgi:hypothetical protein
MTARPARGRGIRTAAAMLAVTAAACIHKGSAIEPAPQPVVLNVSNRGFFDVDVYALPSGASSATRLGTVSGFSESQLVVRPSLLQPGYTLQVRLHPIGTSVTWTSPALSLSEGEQAILQIYSDANGSLNRSVLFPLPDTSSAPPLR